MFQAGALGDAPAEDVVRNLYDVMANTPLVFETVDLTTCADHDKESGTASWALQGATPDASGDWQPPTCFSSLLVV